MTASIRSFFHVSQNTAEETSVGNAYNSSKYHQHDMHDGEVSWLARAPFAARVEGIVVKVKTISGASKITVRLCLDSTGNFSVVPDVEATISTGIGTTTEGTVAFSVDMPVFQNTTGETDALYLFFKTDSGTVTVEETRITWSET